MTASPAILAAANQIKADMAAEAVRVDSDVDALIALVPPVNSETLSLIAAAVTQVAVDVNALVALVPPGISETLTLVQQATSNDPAGSPSATLPTAVTAGNLLIASVMCSNNASATLAGPAGFTQIDSQATMNLATAAYFYKVADGSEGDTFGASSGGNTNTALQVHEISGQDPTSPIDSSSVNTVASALQITSTPVTPSVVGALILVGIVVGGDVNETFSNTWTNGFYSDALISSQYEWGVLPNAPTAAGTSTTEAWATSADAIAFTVVVKP